MCLDFQRYQKLANSILVREQTVTISDINPQGCPVKLERRDSILEVCTKIFDESAYKGAHPLSNSMRSLTNPKQTLMDQKRLNYGFCSRSRYIPNRPFKVAEAY